MQSLPKNSLIYEDHQLMVLDKPSGLVTMGSKTEDSLYARGLQYLQKKDKKAQLFACHRIDKDTSGLVLFAKDDRALKIAQDLFKKRKVQKEYFAIIEEGMPKFFEKETWPEEWAKYDHHLKPLKASGKDCLEITLPIFGIKTKSRIDFEKGNEAYSRVIIEDTANGHSLVRVYPKTGRFHQIRVHLQALGFPIIGDPIYRGKHSKRLMLHAGHLAFTWPPSKKRFEFQSALPEAFKL